MGLLQALECSPSSSGQQEARPGTPNPFTAHNPTPTALSPDFQQCSRLPLTHQLLAKGRPTLPCPSIQVFPASPLVPNPGLGAEDLEMSWAETCLRI